ncbi:DUF192 domain-containing protein [Phaeovibrio sulfidiphilus]|uniref:DUF192 domain-containing protein n=1 Tax=Phaeovibrio sulfidiphilus TaxID=1220600 RepID=A0A8J6YN92_9PROT|nr:DUF192 domain-containing protein [Phaeovibrio sulfidiphilus]MBE1236984.1 DUF192 domain-containing protein [Phaeovibrio sulfidiphilus]
MAHSRSLGFRALEAARRSAPAVLLCAALACAPGAASARGSGSGADAGAGTGTGAPAPAPEVLSPFEKSDLLIECWDGRKLPFLVEEATTPTLRSLGLMYRTSLGADEGMLFVWEDDQPRTMWMKNTPISLDMLFLSRDGIVLHIVRKTTPESEMLIMSPEPARAVLELGAGTTDLLSIEPGDRVLHPLLGATPEDMRRRPPPVPSPDAGPASRVRSHPDSAP